MRWSVSHRIKAQSSAGKMPDILLAALAMYLNLGMVASLLQPDNDNSSRVKVSHITCRIGYLRSGKKQVRLHRSSFSSKNKGEGGIHASAMGTACQPPLRNGVLILSLSHLSTPWPRHLVVPFMFDTLLRRDTKLWESMRVDTYEHMHGSGFGRSILITQHIFLDYAIPCCGALAGWPSLKKNSYKYNAENEIKPRAMAGPVPLG